MITTKISSKNQITLPTYLLKILHIKRGDKLLVQVDRRQLCIKPVGKSLIDSLAGSLTVSQDKKGLAFKKVLKATQKIAAQRLVKS